MLIYKILLRYGYSNFTIEILEYCDPLDVITREQYYLDKLNPEYNILKIAGSLLGYKHLDETKAKIRDIDIAVKLFDTCIIPVLGYASQVWSIYFDFSWLDRLQALFFKKLLLLIQSNRPVSKP